MRTGFLSASLAALAIAAAPAAASAAQAKAGPKAVAAKAPSCSRACLIALADRYMDAMVAKTPGALPWAPVVRFSEDGVPMMIGDALWGSITARSKTPLYAADPTTGQVAWFGVVEEHGEPSFLALRLRISDGRIAEAEAQVRRKGGPVPYGDPGAYQPDPSFARVLPEKARPSRARLIALANGYYDSLERGRLLASFGRDCSRRDNGVVTTSGDQGPAAIAKGCEGQIRAGAFGALGKVRARAVPIVDEARGVVVATGLMDYGNRRDSFRTADGKTYPTLTKYPESHAFIQAFKVEGDAIRRIETVYTPVPYLMPSPWTPAK